MFSATSSDYQVKDFFFFLIQYYGGEKRISCKQAAGFSLPVSELLWFGACCRGGCGGRQRCGRLVGSVRGEPERVLRS